MSKGLTLSIIDVIGKIKTGVGILFVLTYGEKSYELIYWFDKDFNYEIETDKNILDDLDVNDIYEYKNLDYLIELIERQLPDKEKILKDYGII